MQVHRCFIHNVCPGRGLELGGHNSSHDNPHEEANDADNEKDSSHKNDKNGMYYT